MGCKISVLKCTYFLAWPYSRASDIHHFSKACTTRQTLLCTYTSYRIRVPPITSSTASLSLSLRQESKIIIKGMYSPTPTIRKKIETISWIEILFYSYFCSLWMERRGKKFVVFIILCTHTETHTHTTDTATEIYVRPVNRIYYKFIIVGPMRWMEPRRMPKWNETAAWARV